MRTQPTTRMNAAFRFAALFALAGAVGGAGCSVLLPFEDDGRKHCGNGIVDGDEECDGNNLDGWSCESLDLGPGQLGCESDCWLDVRQCQAQPDCGEGICHGPMEDEGTCWDDCQGMPNCGDRECQYNQEDTHRCPADCWCGNGTCDDGENGADCDQDCKEENCNDNMDDDNDGLTDCDDPDCRNVRVCPEMICTDGADNDHDGATDCDDADCYYDPVCDSCGNNICQAGDVDGGCPDECDAIDVSAGGGHTCAVLQDHTVWCWGLNTSGQLGIGTEGPGRDRPVRVAGLFDAVQVSAGGHHTCALMYDETVWCWGRNDGGQLGDGTNFNSPVPVLAHLTEGAVDVSAGGTHTCAVATGGQVFCWGANDSGQLGVGSSTGHNTPQAVGNMTNADGVSAGAHHTCVFLNDDTARCWGNGGDGRLGHGSNVGSSTPVTPSGLAGANGITAGGAHSCAVLTTGGAFCWGSNDGGQLGSGVAGSSSTPVAVDSFGGTAISAGHAHTCALVDVAPLGAQCWGDNNNGQLGHGSDNTMELSPVDVSNIQNVLSVSAGGNDQGSHSCAVTGDGLIWCWGSNEAGRLGRGPGASANRPQQVDIWQ